MTGMTATAPATVPAPGEPALAPAVPLREAGVRYSYKSGGVLVLGTWTGDGWRALDVEERRAVMDARMASSAAQQREEAQRRRDGMVAARDENQDVDRFLQGFEAKAAAVRSEMDADPALKGELEKATALFDGLSARCAEMNEDLSEAAAYLPSYQLRSKQQALTALTNDLVVARAKIVPKKKFKFGAKNRKARAKPAPEPAAAAAAAVAVEAPAKVLATDDYGASTGSGATGEIDDLVARFDPQYLLCKQKGVKLVKRAGGVAGHDFGLVGLEDCVVYILDAVGALYVKDLRRCRIVVGPVCGGVHLSDVHDCSLSIAARQVRMHNSTNTKMHVLTASQPIIERSSGIGFGEYALSYAELGEHMAMAKLVKEEDRGRDVNDFQWLRRAASPNWYVVDAEGAAAEAALRVQDGVL